MRNFFERRGIVMRASKLGLVQRIANPYGTYDALYVAGGLEGRGKALQGVTAEKRDEKERFGAP